jgi:glucose-1-phosphate cytidylyltransferase
VKKIEKYIDEDAFFLTYGDGVADVEISSLLNFHRSKGKIATVTGTKLTSRFGVLIVDEFGIARSFAEKPATDGLINGGFGVFNREIFNYLSEESNFEKDGLQKLAKREEVAVYRHDGFWQCMDTYKEVEDFNRQWKLNNRPWVVWDDDEV